MVVRLEILVNSLEVQTAVVEVSARDPKRLMVAAQQEVGDGRRGYHALQRAELEERAGRGGWRNPPDRPDFGSAGTGYGRCGPATEERKNGEWPSARETDARPPAWDNGAWPPAGENVGRMPAAGTARACGGSRDRRVEGSRGGG
jgi:hypothetical protein